MLIGEDYSVALLQQTWTQELYETSTRYKISGYHSVFDSREDGYGGSAIFIKNSFNYRKVVIDNLSGNSQAIAIAIPKSQIVVVSVYLAPSVTAEDFEEDITKIFESLRNYRKVIIGGDWNAHHIAWGNASCDRKGGIFMELVNQYNWLVLNDGQSTFVPVQLNRRSTAIDVSLCSADLYGELQWTVLEYGVGSDTNRCESRAVIKRRQMDIQQEENLRPTNNLGPHGGSLLGRSNWKGATNLQE